MDNAFDFASALVVEIHEKLILNWHVENVNFKHIRACVINNHRSRYTQMFDGKTVNIFLSILTYAVGAQKTQWPSH